MSGLIRPARGALIVLITVGLALSGTVLFSRDVSGAGPYTVPSVSQVRVAIPTSFLTTGENLLCLVRSDTSGNWVTVRRVCYGSEIPSPAPAPPPPPYVVPVNQQVLTAYLNSSTGQLTASEFSCTEVTPGQVAVSVDLSIQIASGGGNSYGTLTFTIDTTSPFTCTDGAQVIGSVTMSPLASTHNQDGDGCTDYSELDPAAPQDPFNPNDCSVVAPTPTSPPPPTPPPCIGCSVGGIAKLPEVSGEPLSTVGTAGQTPTTLIVMFSGLVVLTCVTAAGVTWCVRSRRPE